MHLRTVVRALASVGGASLHSAAAYAQAAEATQAAVKAGDWYLTQGVLGVTCVILALAVGFLFWRLDRLSGSMMREMITALQANTAATMAGNLTITALERALEATDDGVEKLSHQTELAAQAAASRGAEILKNQEEVKRRLEGRPS